MSDERDKGDKKEDPAEELKQGLTHLWRAARGVAAEVRKEVDRTDVGKALEGASREFVRAAANVVDRIAEEVNEIAKPKKPGESAPPPPPGEPAEAKKGEDEDDEFDGVKPKPREGGEPPGDPGFRIAVDDDEKKKPE
jgi:hypothetical protein